jgi:diacylglycerol kinase (ATP)
MKEAALLHNPKAGDEEHSKKQLIELIEGNGYKCRYSSTKKYGWDEFDANADLIIIAGGDGTVHKVINELLVRKGLEKAPPIALLPMGTANNISRALNVKGSAEQIVQSWEKAKPAKFDVGILDGVPDTDFFIEAFGFGLFPSFINKVSKEKIDNKKTVEAELQAVLQALHEFIFGFEPRKCTLEIDGKDYTGEYLLVEVMNINSIGPNLMFAPDADSSDGLLDVVLVSEKNKEQVGTYILKKLKGEEEKLPLPTIKAKTVRITWDGTKAHADDLLIKLTPFAEVRISVNAGLIKFLL